MAKKNIGKQFEQWFIDLSDEEKAKYCQNHPRGFYAKNWMGGSTTRLNQTNQDFLLTTAVDEAIALKKQKNADSEASKLKAIRLNTEDSFRAICPLRDTPPEELARIYPTLKPEVRGYAITHKNFPTDLLEKIFKEGQISLEQLASTKNCPDWLLDVNSTDSYIDSWYKEETEEEKQEIKKSIYESIASNPKLTNEEVKYIYDWAGEQVEPLIDQIKEVISQLDNVESLGTLSTQERISLEEKRDKINEAIVPFSEIQKRCASNPNLTSEDINHIFSNKSWRAVAEQLLEHPNCPANILEKMASYNDFKIQSAVANNTSTPPQVLNRLSRSVFSRVKLNVAMNPKSPPKAIEQLIQDKNTDISKVAKRNNNADIKFVKESLEDLRKDKAEVLARINSEKDWRERMRDERYLALLDSQISEKVKIWQDQEPDSIIRKLDEFLS